MKKRMKWALILTIAAVSVLAEATAAFGAAGWQEEDGVWKYYNEDGSYVTDTWIKKDNKYYYLDEEGVMATEKLIETGDESYYVDVQGVRVKNEWVRLSAEVLSVNPEDIVWVYLGRDGKAKTGKTRINGKDYVFDEEGRMLTGWQLYSDGGEESLYYLGGQDEGFIHTGWQYLELTDEMMTADGPYFYDNREWFYFSPASGKAYRSAVRKINDKYYEFDANGVMLEGWQGGSGDGDDPVRYYNYGSGERIYGWAWVPGPDDPEGERSFYYFDKEGRPFNLESEDAGGEGNKYTDIGQQEGAQSGMAMLRLHEKTYLFNDQGQMQTGLFELRDVPLGNTKYTGVFYFEGEDEVTVGERQRRSERTITQDGMEYHFCFRNDGSAYENWIKNGKLYGSGGYRIDSDDGPAMVYTLREETGIENESEVLPAGTQVIVKFNGSIVENGTVRMDSRKWIVKDYVATPY